MEELELATDCSGLGSPEEAFKRLKVNHKIAFACEKDEAARKSYSANHKPEIFYDDLTTRDNESAPGSDFYIAGFPCQAFSISGKRLGFEDTRGTIFFNCLEYIGIHKPRVINFENVKGLLSHDKVPGSKAKYGRTFSTIIDALALTINGQHNLYKYDDCVNYHIHFQVLNTKDYGLPQNRERIFIVGFRDEEDSIRFKFPKKIPLELKLKDLLEKNVHEKYYLSEKALNRLLRKESYIPQINPQITGTLNTKNNSGQLSMDNGTTLISDEDDLQLANSRTRMVKSTDSISPTIMANQARQSTDSIIIHEVDMPVQNQVIIDNDNGKIREIGDISTCLDANYLKGMDNHAQRTMVMENEDWVQGGLQDNQHPRTDGIAPTLTSAMGMGGGQIPIVAVKENEQVDSSILFDKENTARGYTEAEPGDSINLSNPNSTTRRGRVGKQVAQTLDTACNQAVLLPMFGTEREYKIHSSNVIYSDEGIASCQKANGGGGGGEKTGLYLTGKRIRRLIPLECFRLQGHSDDFFERCASVNSDTQLYKQAGNAINVDTYLHLLIQILIAIRIPYTYMP